MSSVESCPTTVRLLHGAGWGWVQAAEFVTCLYTGQVLSISVERVEACRHRPIAGIHSGVPPFTDVILWGSTVCPILTVLPNLLTADRTDQKHIGPTMAMAYSEVVGHRPRKHGVRGVNWSPPTFSSVGSINVVWPPPLFHAQVYGWLTLWRMSV